jgi:hypothetical protein
MRSFHFCTQGGFFMVDVNRPLKKKDDLPDVPDTPPLPDIADTPPLPTPPDTPVPGSDE